jgi:hypothetical protein
MVFGGNDFRTKQKVFRMRRSLPVKTGERMLASKKEVMWCFSDQRAGATMKPSSGNPS